MLLATIEPEQFFEVAKILPEALMMLNNEGIILVCNRPCSDIFQLPIREIAGKILTDLLADPVDKVMQYLKMCTRSRSLIVGNLSIRNDQNGEIKHYRSEGGLIKPGSPALILLRLADKGTSTQNFTILNQKLEELSQEIQQRKQTELKLQETNESLREAMKQLRYTQAELVHNEKMIALGQMVAGVAHEINNPLNFISGNLVYISQSILDLLELIKFYEMEHSKSSEIIANKLEEIDLNFLKNDLPHVLESMQKGSERIANIVTSLRTFSRLDEEEFKTIDLNENIDSILVLLNNRFTSNCIQLIKKYGQLPPIACYPAELNQAITNILNNAIDALQEYTQDCHQEKIIAKQVDLPIIQVITELTRENWINIRIINNGKPIPANILPKIFDPFFTTKPIGKGTGLGLTTSYAIISQKHRGQIFCLSNWENGTEFIIEIPINQIGA